MIVNKMKGVILSCLLNSYLDPGGGGTAIYGLYRYVLL